MPRFACRQGLAQAWRWLTTRRSDALAALVEELRLLQYIGLFVECWRQRKRAWRALPRMAATTVVVLWLAGTMSVASAAGRVQLTISDGHVWLVSNGATIQQILAEWTRVGGTQIDNAAAIPGGPLDLQLTDVTEAEALQTLLRDTNVVVVGRAEPNAQASRIERIVVVPQGRPLPDLPPMPVTRPIARPAAAPPSVVQPIIGLNGLPVPDDQQ